MTKGGTEYNCGDGLTFQQNNVQNGITEIYLIDNQKIQNLKDVLIFISLVMLYIHNLQILIYVDKKY